MGAVSANPFDAGRVLCRALGLSPHDVQRIVIEADAGAHPQVSVTVFEIGRDGRGRMQTVNKQNTRVIARILRTWRSQQDDGTLEDDS